MVLINIYKKDETTFTHNGLTTLTPAVAVVTEEINGVFELKLLHPIDRSGKHRALEKGNIIRAPTPRVGEQLFRVYRSVKNLSGECEVNARHISFDLLDNFLEDCRVVNKTCDAAIKQVLASSQYPCGFTGSSDITPATASASYVMTNPLAAILGDADNALIKLFGGELARDNFAISLNTRLGGAGGEEIHYSKNMTGLELTEDTTGVVTRLMPTGLSASGAVLLLPEKYVDSGHILLYPHPLVKRVHYSDVKVGAEVDGVIKYQTEEAAYHELRARAGAVFDTGADLPRVTLVAEFIDRSNLGLNFSRIQLGDDVRVKHLGFGVDYQLRVIRYEWDCLLNRYARITIGDRRPGLDRTMNRVEYQLDGISNTLDGNIQAINIAANAITAEKILAGAIISDKIAARAITTDKLAVGAVVAESIAVGTITAQTGIIAEGAIGTTQIADGSITDAKIVGLTASKITAGTLDAGEINVINLNAANITVGTINGQQIASGAITGEHLIDGAITADKIANGAVTTDKIPYGAIRESQLNWSTHLIY